MKSQRIDRFLGMNTRLPDFSLSVKDVGRYVKDALNVVFNNDGSVESRPTLSLVAAYSGAHSLYENYFIRSAILWEFSFPGGSYSEKIVKVLSNDNRMSYARLSDGLFMSNGVDRLRINANGDFVEWGLVAPDAPVISATQAGLPSGSYQVALSYANQYEEGCLSAASIVDLAEGILVELPDAISGATHINVYASGTNGNVPMFVASVPVGDSAYEITELPSGRESARRIEAVLPAGTRIFEYNGCLCSVNGSSIYVGLPYRHGYYLPAEGFIQFASDVQIAIGNQAGVYVSTKDKTQFMAGADPMNFETTVDVLPYGAIAGTEFDHPTRANVGWFGDKGFVVADNSGTITELMVDAISSAIPDGSAACALSAGYGTNKNYVAIGCGWIVNLETKGASRIEDVVGQVNSFWEGYAMTYSGLCRIGGNAPVNSFVNLGTEGFNSENEKFIPAVYIGASSTAPMAIDVSIASGLTYSYQARSFSETLGVHRADPGKGLRDNWFGLKIKNTDGGLFKLASLSFGQVQSTRKV